MMISPLSLILFAIFFNSHVNSLLIKKIGVVGGGNGGMAFAAALKYMKPKGLEEIIIYEKRNSVLQPSMGGGVQLSGGAYVLSKIGCSEVLHKNAERLKGVRSRNNKNEELLQLNLDNLINTSPFASKLLYNLDTKQPYLYSIMRDALQKILYDACMKKDKNDLKIKFVTKKACNNVIENSNNNKIKLDFNDGSSEDNFDIVIGADGVNSAVREACSGNLPLIPILGLEPGNRYTGIRITFAVTEKDNNFKYRPASGRGEFHQWFGDSCYVLSASYGGLNDNIQHMLALVRTDEQDASLGENVEWEEEILEKQNQKSKQKQQVSTNNSMKTLTKQRLLNAGFHENHELFTLLDGCSEDRFIDLGVKDRSIPLKKWSSDSHRVILLGDSAHAMAPFLGQGANQALQDAYVIAQGITNINNGDDNLSNMVQSYEKLRKLPTASLSLKSNFLGFIETLGGPIGSLVRDNFFRFVGKLGVAGFIFLDGAKPRINTN